MFKTLNIRFEYKRLIYTVFIFILSVPNSYSNNMTKVYYMPFSIGTYSAITRDTFRSGAFCMLTIPDDSDQMNLIYSILSEGKEAKYYDGLVRAEILRPNGKSFYIDQEGSVFDSNSGESAKINEENFEELKNVIQKMFDTEMCRDNIEKFFKGVKIKGFK